MYTVPLMGQQVAIMRLLRGDPVTTFQLSLCFVCTSIAAVVVYLVTARIYRSERLAISA
jgi:sodium transport system permease protein